MSNLGEKRLETALAIATYAIGSGTVLAAPTPGGKLPKQVVLTASDIAMYMSIWKIYFQEDLSNKEVLDMLSELGLVTLTATGAAYIVSKVTTAIVCELVGWFGPVGWGAAAAIATSLNGLFAATWATYCDHLYSQKEHMPA